MAGRKKAALVTIVIGEKYKDMFSRCCEPSWLAYAERFGYDVIVIDEIIDPSSLAHSRSLNWQKCLISEHPEVKDRYETLVWLDADIVINVAKAPCVVSACAEAPDKIGCVSLSRRVENSADQDNIVVRAADLFGHADREPILDVREYYRRYGYEEYVGEAINTGLLVFRPEVHAALFRDVYDTCEQNMYSSSEQVPLAYTICNADAHYLLDYRFNTIWDWELVRNYPFLNLPVHSDDALLWIQCVNAAMMNSYFLHFLAGAGRKGMGFLFQGMLSDRETMNWLTMAANEKIRRYGHI